MPKNQTGRILIMKRKLYALLLAGAMMLSLAACRTSAANPADSGADDNTGISPAPVTAPDAAPAQADTTAAAGSQTIKLTLEGDEGTQEITAAAEFASHLPLSFHMTDYANREKHAHMDFSIDESLLENITVDYEIGDIIYYPPGPTYAMYYDHDGRTISAGMEVIARMDQAGIDALGSYQTDVDVIVALAEP